MFVKAPMALRYASLVSLLFFIAALAVPEGLMRLLTRNEKLVSLGAGYLRWVSASYLMIGVSQIQLAVMKSMPCFATGKLSVPGKCTVPLRKPQIPSRIKKGASTKCSWAIPSTAAIQLGIEDKKGSITAGKDADFLVFENDLLTAEHEGFSYNMPCGVYFSVKKMN